MRGTQTEMVSKYSGCMRLRSGLSLLVVLLISSATGHAQASLWHRYQVRVEATQVNQPHWATPLMTTNARIEQGLRADFVRQTAPNGQTTWNYGNGNGLQIIPFNRTEFRVSVPPFFTHSSPQILDGFGDFAVRVKYRLYGSNEQHRNVIVTGLIGASLPTGKQANGSCCAVLTPALEVGKGFGKLALTSAASGTLPASNTAKLGRSILWNNAIQYHFTKLIWVETEFNATFYRGGRNDGHVQTFTTPGVVISRIPFRRERTSGGTPLSFTLGAGEQIALTHFNTYNHAPIFTGRLRF